MDIVKKHRLSTNVFKQLTRQINVLTKIGKGERERERKGKGKGEGRRS